MDLLLDTHNLIWYLNGDSRLSTKTRTLLESPSSKLWVSIVSLWEISIKINIQKLEYHNQFDLILTNLAKFGIEVFDIHFNELKSYVDLLLHHKDPFDRLLIVQAVSRGLVIITEDQNFKLYQVNLL